MRALNKLYAIKLGVDRGDRGRRGFEREEDDVEMGSGLGGGAVTTNLVEAKP